MSAVLGAVVACPWDARVMIGTADGCVILDFRSGDFDRRVMLRPASARRLASCVQHRESLVDDAFFPSAASGPYGIVVRAPERPDSVDAMLSRMTIQDGTFWNMAGPPCCALGAQARRQRRALPGMQLGISHLGVTTTGLMLHDDDSGKRHALAQLIQAAAQRAESAR